VDLLVKNQDRLIDQLDPNKDHELSESITRLKIFTELFYKTDIYRQLSDLIEEYRHKVTPNTNPGTIGNFLFGCTVNQECTPSCFQGIPPNNLGVCDKQVWILDSLSKTLNRVNKGFSSEALVYITNDTTITPDHLETLRKSDVKKAIIMKSDKGKYQVVETIDLTKEVHPTPKTSPQDETKPSSLWWLWLLIILVVLILIGIVIFFVIRRRQDITT
jgi:hypothetical protein